MNLGNRSLGIFQPQEFAPLCGAAPLERRHIGTNRGKVPRHGDVLIDRARELHADE